MTNTFTHYLFNLEDRCACIILAPIYKHLHIWLHQKQARQQTAELCVETVPTSNTTVEEVQCTKGNNAGWNTHLVSVTYSVISARAASARGTDGPEPTSPDSITASATFLFIFYPEFAA